MCTDLKGGQFVSEWDPLNLRFVDKGNDGMQVESGDRWRGEEEEELSICYVSSPRSASSPETRGEDVVVWIFVVFELCFLLCLGKT